MKMSVLLKLICRFSAIRVKAQKGVFLGGNGQAGFKCYKAMQKDANSQANIEEQRLEDSEAHYTITLINISLGKEISATECKVLTQTHTCASPDCHKGNNAVWTVSSRNDVRSLTSP